MNNFSDLLSCAEENLFIIAEAGVNHNGNLELALQLVDAAVDAGCDAVKFQTWITEKVYSKDKSIKPDYQKIDSPEEESEFNLIKKLELSHQDFLVIKKYCEEKQILFFSTPDEEESANFLGELGVKIIKTASQDVTNIPFLTHVAGLEIPVIFSTGASSLAEMVEGIQAIQKINKDLIVLHCVSSYPAPIEQLNLNMISTLKQLFGGTVGFSDHTSGVEAAAAALALGARVFEKHLTLDKSMGGPDHQASLSPMEMKYYCQTLRGLKKGLGDGYKNILPCEVNTRKAFSRFAVAGKDIAAGATIQKSDIEYKKVVSGILPKYNDILVGAIATIDIKSDEIIDWPMIAFKKHID